VVLAAVAITVDRRPTIHGVEPTPLPASTSPTAEHASPPPTITMSQFAQADPQTPPGSPCGTGQSHRYRIGGSAPDGDFRFGDVFVLEVITANVDDDPAYEVVASLRCHYFWYEKSYDPFVAAFDLTSEHRLLPLALVARADQDVDGTETEWYEGIAGNERREVVVRLRRFLHGSGDDDLRTVQVSYRFSGGVFERIGPKPQFPPLPRADLMLASATVVDTQIVAARSQLTFRLTVRNLSAVDSADLQLRIFSWRLSGFIYANANAHAPVPAGQTVTFDVTFVTEPTTDVLVDLLTGNYDPNLENNSRVVAMLEGNQRYPIDR
jgi:hypothetical protein